MEYKNISFTNARNTFASIIRDAYLNDQKYIVTKRDIPLIKIERVRPMEVRSKKKKTFDNSLFGIWKNKVGDPVKFAEELRRKALRGE